MQLRRPASVLALAAVGCAQDAIDQPCRSSEPLVATMFASDAARSGGCADFRLDVDDSRQVDCLLIDARRVGGDCICDADAGRVDLAPAHSGALDVILADPLMTSGQWNCFCEIPQLAGPTNATCPANGDFLSPLEACQCQVGEPVKFDGAGVDGWCYIDANTAPPVGNAELVADCPEAQREQPRFLGAPFIGLGHTLFLFCQEGADSCAGMH
jgi:hypothetical protein